MRNPTPTVDIIIELVDQEHKIVLIKRKFEPFGWALPGGFVDYGESLEQAAVREAKEETSLDVVLIEQLLTYSDPKRDPRHHNMTTVFRATARGTPIPWDDATEVKVVSLSELPHLRLAFDHLRILQDFATYVRTGQKRRLGS